MYRWDKFLNGYSVRYNQTLMYHELQKYISKKSSPSFWFSFVVHICLLACLLLTSMTLPEPSKAFKLEMTISPSEDLNEEGVTVLSFEGADTGFEITPADLELAVISPPAINLTSFSDMLVEDSVRKLEADNSTFANMSPADFLIDFESDLKAGDTSDAMGNGINGGGQGNGKTGTGNSATTSFYGVRGMGNRFAFVCDVSGSMRGAPFQRLLRELQESITRLPPHAQFYVVFFNENVFPLYWPQSVATTVPAITSNKARLQTWMSRVSPEGETYAFEAINMAFNVNPDTIFLLTDGTFDDEMQVMAAFKSMGQQRPISVHTVSIGRSSFVLQQIAGMNRGLYREVE